MSTDVALSRKQIGGETPMIAVEITDQCVYTGLFGSIDSIRMAEITDEITAKCEEVQTGIVIIDLANVDAIDTAVASHLLRLGDVLRLIGVTPIYCGITGIVARVMTSAGVEFENIIISRDLKSALKKSFQISGYELTAKAS